ncbi:SNF2 family domain-containing protein [Apiospora phragmitis]|uniref:SNF2 family domain-containing protein n=1 Tax=Apiospora phragmitis TaxID=2905665 RepID=A0ABR1W2I3_9PEZI
MSWQDSEEPPTKKRRFFSDPVEDLVYPGAGNAPTSQAATAPPPPQPPLPARPAQDAANGPNTAHDELPIAFDLGMFESFVCSEVEPEVIDVLRRSCRGDIQKAVNMYLDETYKKLMKASPAPKPATQPTRQPFADDPVQRQSDVWDRMDALKALNPLPQNHRYPSRDTLFGDPVRIERQKMQQPRAGRDRQDVIVRFKDAKGTEIGRLAKETADWVSSLIDQGVCKFEGTCFYAPDRLRISLVKLFKEINLAPTRANDVAKNGRQGLLDAAEADEKKETVSANTKNGNKPPGSSPPADDVEEGEELEQGQLDALYHTFAMELRPYQKQSLYWMLSKEKDQKNEDRESRCIRFGEEILGRPKIATTRTPCRLKGNLVSTSIPTLEKCLCSSQNKNSTALVSSNVVAAPKTTLVIAPMSLLAQWQSEAEAASKERTLKSMVYYGNEKVGDLQSMCSESNIASAPDVIITSYGVVLSEFTQISKPGYRSFHTGLFSLNFFRVILDEGHNIKNRQSKTSKACYELNAEHRWVLTGTPIVNRLEDLFSLVRFLRVEPWNNFSFWRTFITAPFESKDFMRALDVVQTVLEPLVMRRTKDMRTPDGKLLVPLPLKPSRSWMLNYRRPNVAYTNTFSLARSALFSKNIEKGTVMKAYTTIFAQILRLRQTCCHPLLVRNQDLVADEEEAGAQADAAAGLSDDMDLQSLIEKFTDNTDIRDRARNECPVCSEEPMIEQTVTGCWHSACKKCLLDYMKHSMDRHQTPRCFNCREPLSLRDLFEVVRHDDDPAAGSSTPKISLQRLGERVVVQGRGADQHLRALRKEHPVMKSVVFSQFTSFMSLIEPALTRANMRFLRLDGFMAQKARAAVLEEFRASNRFTILLISLRAGGVGLNLTQAKRVYMMDPWWSFAVEAQAIDRVHRMGQDDEVKVYRFIAKESVEERMLKVQDRKKFIATSLGMMTDEEKKLQRIEDIKELLS